MSSIIKNDKLLLIKYIQEKEILWNAKHPAYYNRKLRTEAWAEIGREIFKSTCRYYEVNEMKKCWRILKIQYNQRKTKLQEDLENGIFTVTKWQFYDIIGSFIDSSSSMQVQTVERPIIQQQEEEVEEEDQSMATLMKICYEMNEKIGKMEREFGKEVAELRKENAKLRVVVTKNKCQIVKLNREIAKLSNGQNGRRQLDQQQIENPQSIDEMHSLPNNFSNSPMQLVHPEEIGTPSALPVPSHSLELEPNNNNNQMNDEHNFHLNTDAISIKQECENIESNANCLFEGQQIEHPFGGNDQNQQIGSSAEEFMANRNFSNDIGGVVKREGNEMEFGEEERNDINRPNQQANECSSNNDGLIMFSPIKIGKTLLQCNWPGCEYRTKILYNIKMHWHKHTGTHTLSHGGETICVQGMRPSM